MFVFVVGYCCESIDYTGDDGNDDGSVDWCISGEGRVSDWFVTEEMTSACVREMEESTLSLIQWSE
jgi:hypothetical protein